jgi:predicted DCC family thiol-disulfide oxidoreductase YuxK
MTASGPDPTALGGGGIHGFTVLYDEYCPLCRAARRWLGSRAQLVPLEFLPAGSAAARQRFPGLDPADTLRDLTVVADTGDVYVGDGAWLACLWALVGYRGMANGLARPHLLPMARKIIAAASAVRERTRAGDAPGARDDLDPGSGYGDDDDRADCADDRCG